MSILGNLSLRHLKLHAKRTAITVIGIAMSVAMAAAISGFILSFQDMLYNNAVKDEGLWHVRYSALTADMAENIAKEPIFADAVMAEGEGGIELSLIFAKLDRGIFDRSEEVCFRYGITQEQVRYHNNLLIAKGIVPGNYYDSLYAFAAILLTIVTIASVMVISNAFSISASERSRQFGILKSVGATRSQIKALVLWEGMLLGILAIPIGLILGFLAQWIALSIANSILSNIDAITLDINFRVIISPWVILTAVIAAFVTIFTAAWLPAGRASKQSAIDAIRQTSEVKINPKDVRIMPLTVKVFGFNGLLAAKTMKRNRRRYRTTIISLSVSIVLYIAVSSFGQMLFKSASMVYEDYGTNTLIQLYGADEDIQNRLAENISDKLGEPTYYFRSITGSINISQEQMTENGLDILQAGEKHLNLFSFKDEVFKEICESIGVDSKEFENGEPACILLNTTGTYIKQGRRHNFTPFKPLSGERLSLDAAGTQREITVKGETSNIPIAINMFISSAGVNLIIPDSLRMEWKEPDGESRLNTLFVASDPYAFEISARDYLSENLPESQYYIINYEDMAENNRNIWLLIMIFVYGFIAMLSAVSVTNVVTTIITGIALRKREFAVLNSMGMTKKDILKSLRYESLIYGIKSLLFGIPLGLLASLLMYRALDISMSFEYIWPVQSIMVSILAVLIITTVTMNIAAYKQRGENIASVLQNEVL